MDKESMEKSRKRFYDMGYILMLILLFCFILWLLSFVQGTAVIIIGSIFVAYLILPIVNFFENPIVLKMPKHITILKKKIKLRDEEKKITLTKKGFSRIVSLIIVYLIIALLIVILISFVVPNISKEFDKFVDNFPNLSSQFMKKLDEANEWLKPKLPESAKDIVPRTIAKITAKMEVYIYQGAHYTLIIVQKVLSATLAFFVIPLFTFYILIDLERFKKGFQAMIPSRKREEVLGLMRAIDRMLGRFIRGQILVAIFVAVAITIALSLMGIDYAFLIGLLSGIVNFIPYLGVIISLVPAITLAIIYKGFFFALLVAAVLMLIQQFEGQVISPLIMGEAVGLPALIIIVAIIIGGQSLGIAGMLIAIPAVATIKVIIQYYSEKNGDSAEKSEENKDGKEKPEES